MEKIINNWVKTWGYTPTESEIINAYRCGELILTYSQEDEILKLIDKLNL